MKMLSQCSSRVLAALARNGCAAGNVVHIQSANIASSAPAASDRGGRDVVKSLTSKKIIFEKNVHVPSLGGTLSVRTPLDVKVSLTSCIINLSTKLLSLFRSCH